MMSRKKRFVVRVSVIDREVDAPDNADYSVDGADTETYGEACKWADDAAKALTRKGSPGR
jgi:hypothetical protein